MQHDMQQKRSQKITFYVANKALVEHSCVGNKNRAFKGAVES